MSKSFYVYQLRAETEECPFYVGKGQGNRKSQHVCDARRGKKSLKDSKIRKYEKAGIKILIEILFRSESEEECFALEVELIKSYGRRDKGLGCLTNQTDGGEGSSGASFSDERKQQMSAIMSGRVRDADHCRNISKVKTGHLVSEKTKAKISRSLTGRKLHPDHVEKLRKSSTGRVYSEETKAKISAAHTGRMVPEAQKLQISKTLKGHKRNESSVDKSSKYSRQVAIHHVKTQRCSGLSQKQYCLQHSIKEQTFCGWKRSPYVMEALENL
jgi:NUMOD3 motif